MEPIQIMGIDELEGDEREVINRLINEHYNKIKRSLNEITSITVHIKQHSKGGKRKKSDVRVRVDAPSQIFEAQESDWDLARTLHKVFENIQREMEHKLRVDDQRDKPYA